MTSTHPGIRVLLVGEGPERPVLEAAVSELGLKAHVVLAGWRTDPVDLLAAVDIVVQPSTEECFSQAMVEAMAVGKPLVMTDVSGARDAISNGRNGVLVPPGDADAIAVALRTLLDDPKLARRLGEAAQAHVRASLDIRSVVRQYEECYLSVHAQSHAA